jgi:hypothetical protein
MASRRQRQWRRDVRWLPTGEEPPYRAIEMQIGKELQARYEPPRELPHRLLALLMQMNGRNKKGPDRR